MIWGMFFPDSFPLSMVFPFHFFQSGLSDGELLIDMPRPSIPELPICHHSLYPSNLTCALLIFQQLGMGKSALGENSKELACITQPWCTRHCALVSHSIPVTIWCSRDVICALHRGNWVSKKPCCPKMSSLWVKKARIWTKAFWHFLIHCDP